MQRVKLGGTKFQPPGVLSNRAAQDACCPPLATGGDSLCEICPPGKLSRHSESNRGHSHGPLFPHVGNSRPRAALATLSTPQSRHPRSPSPQRWAGSSKSQIQIPDTSTPLALQRGLSKESVSGLLCELSSAGDASQVTLGYSAGLLWPMSESLVWWQRFCQDFSTTSPLFQYVFQCQMSLPSPGALWA